MAITEYTGKPTPAPLPPKLTLTGKSTSFTLSLVEAPTMSYFWGMMRSREIAQVTHDELLSSGFDGWWNPVEKLIGCIEWGRGETTFIAKTLPWDGAMGGQWGDDPAPFYSTQTTRIKKGQGSSLPNYKPYGGAEGP